MTKHLEQQELDDYRQRRMPAADLLMANRHLSACEECYTKFHPVSSLAETVDFVRADLRSVENESEDHLSFEQMIAYLDMKSDEVDREMVAVHLELCPECDDVCRDLRRFKTEQVIAKAEAPLGQPALKAKVALLSRTSTARIPIRALALGMIAIAAIGFFAWSLREITTLRSQVSRLQEQQKVSQDEASTGLTLQSQRAELDRLRDEIGRLHRLTESLKSESATFPPDGPNALSRAGAEIPGIEINDGDRRITLDRQGNLNGLSFLSPDHRKAVMDALRSGEIRVSSKLSQLTGKRRQLMSSDGRRESFIPLTPVGVVVAKDRPVFSWNPLNGALSYIVTIYRNNLEVVASSPPLSETEWTPPPLPRDRQYSWQIVAIKEGREVISPHPSAPEARFRVLSRSEVDELERAKRHYSKSHLTLGVLFARLGLLEDAAAEFRALQETNPNSPLVEKLLHRVIAEQRGHTLR